MLLRSVLVSCSNISSITSSDWVFIDGHPVLATASEAGHISLWDLNAGGRLLHTVRGAHDGGITALEWVAGQPVLISSGEDNSVKVCSFSHLLYAVPDVYLCVNKMITHQTCSV